jgi:hypothetical protein
LSSHCILARCEGIIRWMSTPLNQLLSRSEEAGGARVSADDLAAWAGESDEDEARFFNEIGAEIAKRYNAGELSYEFCDLVVNDLWGLLMKSQLRDPQGLWPDTFSEVYEAFDAGEYHRQADRSDDPIAEYTAPAVAAIVDKL